MVYAEPTVKIFPRRRPATLLNTLKSSYFPQGTCLNIPFFRKWILTYQTKTCWKSVVTYYSNILILFEKTDAVTWMNFVQNVFLKIPQSWQINPCVGVFFNNLVDLRPAILFKKRFQRNFVKFLRTTFFIEKIQRLVLKKRISLNLILLLTLFRMGVFGAVTDEGAKKAPPP